MSAAPFGVNVAGDVASEKGAGEGARSTIPALAAAGIPYVVDAFTDPGSQNRETITQVLLYLCREAGFPAVRIFYPQDGGFTQRAYATAGDYAVVAEA